MGAARLPKILVLKTPRFVTASFSVVPSLCAFLAHEEALSYLRIASGSFAEKSKHKRKAESKRREARTERTAAKTGEMIGFHIKTSGMHMRTRIARVLI